MLKTCCCTGHRPKGFPFKHGIDKQKHTAYLHTLEQKIELAITEYGITNAKSKNKTIELIDLCTI